MAKTYPDIGTFTSGQILTAATMNQVGDNLDNQRIPPMVKCVRSGNLSYTANTDIAWNSETSPGFDTDGMHNTVTDNARITPTTAGVYVITAAVTFTFSGTSSNFTLKILKNGSDFTNRLYDVTRTTTHRDAMTVVDAANGTTDYYTCQFSMDGGSSFSLQESTGSFFSALWIGQTS